jgi:protein-tyrosine sulfotransferase
MAPTFPIFILSTERSGSTLLRYILDTHPDICCPGELYLGRLAKDLSETVSRTLGLTAGEQAQDQDQMTWGEVHRIIDDLLSNFARVRGKKIWCDKTPFNLKNLSELEKAFPDARYICLYRNSLDVVHSGLDLKEKSYIWWALPYVVKHPKNYAAALLESWIDKTQLMLDFEKNHSQTCRVQYETLVENPVKALTPVFQFLGLDWDASLLEKTFKIPHDPGGGDYKITSTTQIEKNRVGKGNQIDSALMAAMPPPLLQKQKQLHAALGYA